MNSILQPAFWLERPEHAIQGFGTTNDMHLVKMFQFSDRVPYRSPNKEAAIKRVLMDPETPARAPELY